MTIMILYLKAIFVNTITAIISPTMPYSHMINMFPHYGLLSNATFQIIFHEHITLFLY